MARLTLQRFAPGSLAGQMIAVLGISFTILLAILTAAEQSDGGDVARWAESEFTVGRLKNLMQVLPYIRDDELNVFIEARSRCHDGYALSTTPYDGTQMTPETRRLATTIANELQLSQDAVQVGRAALEKDEFGYLGCAVGEMSFPLNGLVVSVRQPSSLWLHAEVHPHEWHFGATFFDWFRRSVAVFLIVAGIAVFFMHRLGQPLRRLAVAARGFGEGLTVNTIEESGPLDVRRTIGAFNAMQQQVTEEVRRRTNTLAALSHDLRTPLTGLRVKTELIEDPDVRADLLVSIRKMESIINASLEFLRGESLDEPLRLVDLTALVESECADVEENGGQVTMASGSSVRCYCRADAVARAVRNLIDNALKYAGHAEVSVSDDDEWVEVRVADNGPGLPTDLSRDLTEPFVRSPPHGGPESSGFGLGLAVVKAVADGHKGKFELRPNSPSGLLAVLRLPRTLESKSRGELR